MREAKKCERERLQAEKRAAGTIRRRRGSCSQAMEAATPPQHQRTPTTAPHLHTLCTPMEAATPPQIQPLQQTIEQGPPTFTNRIANPQFIWAGSTSVNPMSLTSNSPFYYSEALLLHLFLSRSRNLTTPNTNDSISWLGKRLWEVGAGGTDQGTQHHCS